MNFLKWVLHTFVGSLLIMGLGIVLSIHPAWLDATFYAALLAAYNWAITASGARVGFAKKY